jgi:N-acetylglucosamine-6-sulfatase
MTGLNQRGTTMSGFFRTVLAPLSLTVALFAMSVPVLAQRPPARPAPPNIVVVMADDQRDADPLERMPHVEALMVKKGVRFINSFAVNPICCAARASFLTGQYSHNNNVWDNNPGPRPGGFQDFKGDDNTIACWTQKVGYRTALIGKYLNGYGNGGTKTYIPPCWNYWWALTRPYRYYDYEADDNGTVREYGRAVKDYQEDVVSGLAQKFIASSTQPFFLWVTGIAPHGGYPGVNSPVPPERYKDAFKHLKLPRPPSFNESDFSDKPKFMRKHVPLMDHDGIELAVQSYRKRAATVLSIDDMVSALIHELAKKGELKNTYFVFTSDNGFFNGEHRPPVGKHLLYEESIRVPLVIRGPGIPEGQTRSEMVNNLDLSTTLVELAGATAGRVADGRSLVPLFSGDQAWRTAMLLEGDDVVPQSEDLLYGYYSAVRTVQYKYAEHVNRKEAYVDNEFYDLSADPYEIDSRPGDPNYQTVIDQLKPLLANLRSCAGDNCWVSDTMRAGPPMPRVKPQIGAPCMRNCAHLDVRHTLEPAEFTP